MEENTWYPVRGYEGLYEINIKGDVKSVARKAYHLNRVTTVNEKILKQRVDRGGYFTVALHKGTRSSSKYVHRLLLIAFLPNPQNKPFVNHINGNKLDNTFENLEWVTHSENMLHAYRSGFFSDSLKRCRKIVDNCTGRYFSSIAAAAEFYSLNYNTVRNMLSGANRNNTCLQYA